MKIVVLDGYTENPGDLSWDGLKALGEVTVYDRTEPGRVVERVGSAEAVYSNKTPLTREMLAAMPNVRFIGVLATGYNVVDVQVAREKGAVVANIPTYGTDAVAQYVFALLLEMCHHVAYHNEAVQKGRWAASPDFSFWDYPLIELAGKTMGIVGYGRIGRRTAEIAKAFKMNVLAYDRYADPEIGVPLDELYAKSDVISLHCPLLPDTLEMIRTESIAKIKKGVMLINTSHGHRLQAGPAC